jgi:hypothetical protein
MSIEIKLFSDFHKETEGIFKKAENLKNSLPKAVNDCLDRFGTLVQGYLRGPRPLRLNVLTGRLIKSFQNRPHYETGGTGSGINMGIHRVEVQNNQVIGVKGTMVKSPKGFDYPARWEYGGNAGIAPIHKKVLARRAPNKIRVSQTDTRPFVAPALADFEPMIPEIIYREINKAIS